MINIENIYHTYISYLNDERQKKRKDVKDWYSASASGYCYKKQYYMKTGTEGEPMDKRVSRLLRLGTVVHSDIEKSLLHAGMEKNGKGDIDFDIYTEYEITLPKLNVIGHLDHMFISKSQDVVYINDLKTVNDWTWKKKFGRKYKEDKPSPHYFMQIGTYALGVKRVRGDDVKSDYYLNIVWYNKNDSKIKIQPVDPVWIDRAEQYWHDLNDFIDETGDEILNIKPDTAVGVPMMNWECNYCQFNKICKGE